MTRLLYFLLLIGAGNLFAQTLPLPPRPAAAPDGDAFAKKISTLDLATREAAIAKEFLTGNTPKFLREFCEVWLHPVPHHENDFVNLRRVIKFPPSVCDDRAARDFQPELVHVRAHARAASGGDDDRGNHRVNTS